VTNYGSRLDGGTATIVYTLVLDSEQFIYSILSGDPSRYDGGDAVTNNINILDGGNASFVSIQILDAGVAQPTPSTYSGGDAVTNYANVFDGGTSLNIYPIVLG
jgi:hypothetical protein